MSTATKPRTRKRATKRTDGDANGQAVGFDVVSLQTKVGTLRIATAQDSKGEWYGDFAVQWKDPDDELENRNSQLVPARARKFTNQKFARTHAATEACDWLGGLLLQRLSDQQLAAIDTMLEAAREYKFREFPDKDQAEDAGAAPQPTVAEAAKPKRRPSRRTASMPPVDDPDAVIEEVAGEGGGAAHYPTRDATEILEIPVDQLHRHPANRQVVAEGLEGLAESLKAYGLQQPIKVRRVGEAWGLPEGHYQIVFGERRWAAAKLAQWDTIPAVVCELSDEQTLELIATENSQREDLDDLQRAAMLRQLIQPIGDGGCDKTVKEAAAVMGMAESTARNLMRVAELPAFWTDKIVSGEMESSKLRPIAAFRDCPPVMDALAKAYQTDASCDWRLAESWGTRDAVSETVEAVAYCETYPLTPGDLVDEDGLRTPPKFDASKLNAKTRSELKIHDVPDGKGGTVQRCFNTAAWRKLQQAAESKTAGNGTGKAKPTNPKPLTPAEEQAAAKKRAEQRKRSIDLVRLEMLRHGCERALSVGSPTAWRLLIYAAASGTISNYQCGQAIDAMLESRKIRRTGFSPLYPALAKIDDGDAAAAACDVLRQLLVPGCLVADNAQPMEPDNLGASFVEDLARELGVDLAAVWADAQRGTSRPGWFLRFFNVHDKPTLEQLAKELGVNLFGMETKKRMVDAFCQQQKQLKLPKGIKPLKVVRKKQKK